MIDDPLLIDDENDELTYCDYCDEYGHYESDCPLHEFEKQNLNLGPMGKPV